MKYLGLLMLSLVLALPAAAQAGQGHGMGGHMGDGGFSKMDTDGDGFVSRGEFGDPFAKWDANGDGKLDAEEWQMGHGVGTYHAQKGYHGKTQCPSGGMMRGNAHYPTLEQLDKSGDGMLDRAEYEAAVPGGGFDLIDTDKSGMLEAKEWEFFRAAHMGMGGKKKY